MYYRKNMTGIHSKGFTIVELLVVIVVIGILAAITIVAYTGITTKAAIATLKSDLKNSYTRLALDNTTNGSYPSSELEANSGKGLPKSSGTNYVYAVTSTGYCLSATSAVASSTLHILTNGSIESGGCPLSWSNISVGDRHSCAIASNNQVYCWGNNANGQLGNGSTTRSLIPIAVDTTGVLSGKTIKYLSVGGGYTCVVASDNLAYCWGQNYYGQLGINSTTDNLVPVAVNTAGVLSGKTIKAIVGGDSTTCAIASDNLVYCWGYNANGQVGDNSTTQSNVPVAVNTAEVLNGKTIQSVSLGSYHTCAVASDDLAYCWGRDTFGQLGNNSTTQSNVPVAVNTAGVLNGKTIKSVMLGDHHSCVIASDDLVYCWGYNYYGQLGNNSTTQSNVPVAVNTAGVLNGKTIKSVAPSSGSTCVLASDDLSYCWGTNDFGRLGNNSTTPSLVPVPVDITGVLSGKTVVSISADYANVCIITSDNNGYCWGWGVEGQLGNNTIVNSSIPVAPYALP